MMWLRRLFNRSQFFDLLNWKRDAWKKTPGDGIKPIDLPKPTYKVTRQVKVVAIDTRRSIPAMKPTDMVFVYTTQTDADGREKRN